MAWQIEFTDGARKQLAKLAHLEAKRIRDYLRHRIGTLDNPRDLGKALTGQHAGLWRYRVGDYRLICEMRDDVLVVLVLRIGHRREVYR